MSDTKFINAQQMAREFPQTFTAPTADELKAVKVGMHVKLCVGKERFWLKVETIKDGTLFGCITQDLVRTHLHGLKDGDKLSFHQDNIYQILT